jgi:hypothetical protein
MLVTPVGSKRSGCSAKIDPCEEAILKKVRFPGSELTCPGVQARRPRQRPERPRCGCYAAIASPYTSAGVR